MSHGERFFAIKDALRVAIVQPLSFFLALHVFDSAQMALFAAFGPMALMVFVQFGGTRRHRLTAYASLALGGAALIALGTLCSQSTVAATAAMALLGFAIIFAGVFDGYVAAAQRGAILAFVLAVMVPADAAAIGPRVAGWGLASLLATAAIFGLWPRRAQSAVRGAAGEAAYRLAALAETAAAGDRQALAVANRRASEAVRETRARFNSLPQRPSGNGGTTAGLARTIDHMGWLRTLASIPSRPVAVLRVDSERAAIERELPVLLRQIGDRLSGAPASAGPHVGPLREAHRRLGEEILARFAELPQAVDEDAVSADLDEVYRLRQVAFGALQLAEDVVRAVGDPVRGEGRERARARVAETRELTRAHATMRSVWLRNRSAAPSASPWRSSSPRSATCRTASGWCSAPSRSCARAPSPPGRRSSSGCSGRSSGSSSAASWSLRSGPRRRCSGHCSRSPSSSPPTRCAPSPSPPARPPSRWSS
jgi:hypothetical protein